MHTHQICVKTQISRWLIFGTHLKNFIEKYVTDSTTTPGYFHQSRVFQTWYFTLTPATKKYSLIKKLVLGVSLTFACWNFSSIMKFAWWEKNMSCGTPVILFFIETNDWILYRNTFSIWIQQFFYCFEVLVIKKLRKTTNFANSL